MYNVFCKLLRFKPTADNLIQILRLSDSPRADPVLM